jgi:hypothetical protein
VHFSVDPVAPASDIAKEGDRYLIIVFIEIVFIGLPPICNDIWMIVPPCNGWRFAGADVPGYLCNFNGIVDPFFPFL